VDTSVGGIHALFIVRGDPRLYNLPDKPEVPTIHLRTAWTSAAVAGAAMIAGTVLAFLGNRAAATPNHAD
jgi:formate dehydrogenase iron-sulfur subunit